MKLTDDQINTLYDTADSERKSKQSSMDGSETTTQSINDTYGSGDLPARRVMVESIIEGYQALEPAPAVRWIPAVNRKPTEEDFTVSGHILTLQSGEFVVVHNQAPSLELDDVYWMSINDVKCLPKEPVSPEIVEENEFTQWWATLTVDPFQTHTKDVARAAWKAARNK